MIFSFTIFHVFSSSLRLPRPHKLLFLFEMKSDYIKHFVIGCGNKNGKGLNQNKALQFYAFVYGVFMLTNSIICLKSYENTSESFILCLKRTKQPNYNNLQ